MAPGSLCGESCDGDLALYSDDEDGDDCKSPEGAVDSHIDVHTSFSQDFDTVLELCISVSAVVPEYACWASAWVAESKYFRRWQLCSTCQACDFGARVSS